MEHLEDAQAFLRNIWGSYQFERLSTSTLSELDEQTQSHLSELLGKEAIDQYKNLPLGELPSEEIEIIKDEFGRKSLTEIYRQLLLRIITELWVEYLTQMEALRVSIGLEAYAQRDPLVQYKNRAYELFQNLFEDMRTSVINRMFTYRPADLNAVQQSTRKMPTANIPAILTSIPAKEIKSTVSKKIPVEATKETSTSQTPENQSGQQLSKSAKRRRRRKKK